MCSHASHDTVAGPTEACHLPHPGALKRAAVHERSFRWLLPRGFQEGANETLADVKNFNYTKFFNGRKFELAVKWLGSALFTSALSREASLRGKSIKNTHRHTNKLADSAVDQAITAVCLLLHHCEFCSAVCPCHLRHIQQSSMQGIHHGLQSVSTWLLTFTLASAPVRQSPAVLRERCFTPVRMSDPTDHL